MAQYILRRLLAVPFLLIGVTAITFAIVHLVPGSPVQDLRVRIPGMRQEDVQRIERTLGLDKPVHEQYLSWLGQLLRGDLGISMANARPVRTQILERLPNTLLLTATAMIVALTLAVPMGIVAAVRRNSVFDHLSNLLASVGFAVPTFWIGLLLILFFSVQASTWGLPALPSSGMRSVTGDDGVGDRLRHLILPVATLSVVQVAGWLRYIRSQMIEVLAQDYVRTARSKGLAERAVLFGHAFRNALLPLVTLVGLSVPELVAGAVVVEPIFSWPGIGALSLEAAQNHDYTLIMGMTVFIALVTLLANLVTDVVYAVVDPRISYRSR
jgi:peptide/nickel transport system permease protein